MRFTMLLFALSLAVSPAQADTLFEDLGGEARLRQIVDEVTAISLDDPRIKDTFADTNIPRFKGLLYDQLCELTGGPCVYEGDDMLVAHDHLDITTMQFNALVENLQKAMRRTDVPFFTQNRLLALLAPMADDVIGG